MSGFYFRYAKIKIGSMKIGSLDLGYKLFLAPMADVTDTPFRTIAKKYGAGITFTQMVSAKGIIENNFETLKLIGYSRDEKPVGIQLLVSDPDIAYRAVKDLSYRKPDMIDLNCGCPIEKVTKHNMGAKLLNDPPRIGRLINSMVKAAGDIPISVKLRLGRDRRKVNILDTLKAAEDNGASLAFVHARAATDRYDIEADWNFLSDIAGKCNIPIVGNGSVFEAADAVNMLKETGVASVLIARGALGNPFLFDRFNKIMETGTDPGRPSLEVVHSLAVEHLGLIRRERDNSSGLANAKKNIFWYFRYYNGVFSLIEDILGLNSFDDVILKLDDHVKKIQDNSYSENDFDVVMKRFKKRVIFWLGNS